MDALTQFQEETRAWLEENCPASMRTPILADEVVWGGRKQTFPNPDAKLWLERMAGKGWTCPLWPQEYGGGGLSMEENKVLQQELMRLHARQVLTSFGISMLGPVLLEFGTEEQKLEHIPKIVQGEIRWCQGYSEPGAGSDLASLQTRAVLDGDDYIVNGTKTWTSYADKSDWIFCLVRTDPDVPKHNGISFILFDMDDPGVRTSPIKLISGTSQFCETSFENVRVPRRHLIGNLNDGWTIAKRLLQHERTMISTMGLGGVGTGGGAQSSLETLAKEYLGERNGKIAAPLLRDKIALHKMDGEIFALTVRRSGEEAKSDSGPSATSSMFKYYGTEHNKNRYELMLQAMGCQSLGWEGEGFDARELSTAREWLRSKGNSIEGGTSEIQLNIIAKRVLGLPD